eukprot:Pgem_evm1s14741
MMAESITLIFLTRKAWTLFCDVGLNVRLYIFFILTWLWNGLINCAFFPEAMSQTTSLTLLVYYFNVAMVGYLFDAFGLVLVKIYTRRYGFSIMDDFSMVAQKEFDDSDVVAILYDRELFPYLLEVAKERLSHENVLFLNEMVNDLGVDLRLVRYKKESDNTTVEIDIESSEFCDKDLEAADLKMVSFTKIESLYAKYIDRGSSYELNLSCNITNKLQEEKLKLIEEHTTELSVYQVITMFEDCIDSVLMAITHNLLERFKENEEVQSKNSKAEASERSNNRRLTYDGEELKHTSSEGCPVERERALTIHDIQSKDS